jgi:hypothetical protein
MREVVEAESKSAQLKSTLHTGEANSEVESPAKYLKIPYPIPLFGIALNCSFTSFKAETSERASETRIATGNIEVNQPTVREMSNSKDSRAEV